MSNHIIIEDTNNTNIELNYKIYCLEKDIKKLDTCIKFMTHYVDYKKFDNILLDINKLYKYKDELNTLKSDAGWKMDKYNNFIKPDHFDNSVMTYEMIHGRI